MWLFHWLATRRRKEGIEHQGRKGSEEGQAVCNRSVMIGAVDEQGGTPVVSAVYALPEWIVNGFILDDGRKCLTLGNDGVMTLWGIDRPGNAGKP